MELLGVMQNLSITRSGENGERLLFKSACADVDGVSTEVVFAEYSDKTFLIASQYQKIGGLILVEKDQVHNPLGSNDIYTTKVIFGAPFEEQEAAARYLAEQIKITKPLYLSVSLRSYDIETLKAIKDIVEDIKSGRV